MMFRFLFRSRLLFKFTLFGLGLLSGALSASNVYAAAPTILVYGDSLSAAYGIPREQGWVALLQAQLKSAGLPHQVINTSISGETTTGGASRIKTTLSAHSPDIVLIELGANDGLRGLPLTDMQSNLKQIIEACQQSKARVVLVGMMIPPNYGPRYANEFNASYVNLAKKYNLALVPFLLDGVAGKPELNQDDGLHPTAKAQAQVLANVWSVLKPELLKHQAK